MSWSPSAKVIRDSLSPTGERLTTFEVEMHRFVLAEFNTHRVLSRNSASSRAIPVTTMLEKASEETAVPVSWPKEQAGMQGGTELEGHDLFMAQNLYDDILNYTIRNITEYVDAVPKAQRLHKSVLNRLLEPFLPHKAIVSATDWDSFFAQRLHEDAQPEIHVLAIEMEKVYKESVSIELSYAEYHTPYIDNEDINAILYAKSTDFDNPIWTGFADLQEVVNAVSVARCARVSYLTHDKKRDIEKDIELYFRLKDHIPAHASPFEHVARPSSVVQSAIKGNFTGFIQLRHELGMV